MTSLREPSPNRNAPPLPPPQSSIPGSSPPLRRISTRLFHCQSGKAECQLRLLGWWLKASGQSVRPMLTLVRSLSAHAIAHQRPHHRSVCPVARSGRGSPSFGASFFFVGGEGTGVRCLRMPGRDGYFCRENVGRAAGVRRMRCSSFQPPSLPAVPHRCRLPCR